MDTNLVHNNPQLQFVQNQIALAEAEKRLANAERLPDFRAGYFIQSIAGAQEVDGQVVNYNATPRFQGFQAGISIPIFGAKGYRARTEAAAVQVLAQQKHSEYLQTQLQSQLRQSAGQFVFGKTTWRITKTRLCPMRNPLSKTPVGAIKAATSAIWNMRRLCKPIWKSNARIWRQSTASTRRWFPSNFLSINNDPDFPSFQNLENLSNQ
ncbi:MAG: TolC family protein [Saprospiraceae bacterium]|nr:TolC family protein [Saprospiraceae bacterium]